MSHAAQNATIATRRTLIPPWLGPPLVALGAAMWATDSLFRSVVVHKYGPFFIVFFNHWLALIPALPTLLARRRQLRQLTWRDALALAFVAGCGSVLGMACFTRAFATAANYTVPVLVQKLQPLFAIVLARLFLGERMVKSFIGWAVLALFGAYLVSFGFGLQPSAALGGTALAPVVYAAAAAALWGATTVAGRLLLRERTDFVFVTAARFAFGSLFALAAAAALGELSMADLQAALTVDLLPFLGMAFLSGLLPLAIYYLGLRSTRASVATLCELAFPVAAIIVNWLFLDAALSMPQLVGAGLLFIAITALTIASARSNAPHPEGRGKVI